MSDNVSDLDCVNLNAVAGGTIQSCGEFNSGEGAL